MSSSDFHASVMDGNITLYNVYRNGDTVCQNTINLLQNYASLLPLIWAMGLPFPPVNSVLKKFTDSELYTIVVTFRESAIDIKKKLGITSLPVDPASACYYNVLLTAATTLTYSSYVDFFKKSVISYKNRVDENTKKVTRLNQSGGNPKSTNNQIEYDEAESGFDLLERIHNEENGESGKSSKQPMKGGLMSNINYLHIHGILNPTDPKLSGKTQERLVDFFIEREEPKSDFDIWKNTFLQERNKKQATAEPEDKLSNEQIRHGDTFIANVESMLDKKIKLKSEFSKSLKALISSTLTVSQLLKLAEEANDNKLKDDDLEKILAYGLEMINEEDYGVPIQITEKDKELVVIYSLEVSGTNETVPYKLIKGFTEESRKKSSKVGETVLRKVELLNKYGLTNIFLKRMRNDCQNNNSLLKKLLKNIIDKTFLNYMSDIHNIQQINTSIVEFRKKLLEHMKSSATNTYLSKGLTSLSKHWEGLNKLLFSISRMDISELEINYKKFESEITTLKEKIQKIGNSNDTQKKILGDELITKQIFFTQIKNTIEIKKIQATKTASIYTSGVVAGTLISGLAVHECLYQTGAAQIKQHMATYDEWSLSMPTYIQPRKRTAAQPKNKERKSHNIGDDTYWVEQNGTSFSFFKTKNGTEKVSPPSGYNITNLRALFHTDNSQVSTMTAAAEATAEPRVTFDFSHMSGGPLSRAYAERAQREGKMFKMKAPLDFGEKDVEQEVLVPSWRSWFISWTPASDRTVRAWQHRAIKTTKAPITLGEAQAKHMDPKNLYDALELVDIPAGGVEIIYGPLGFWMPSSDQSIINSFMPPEPKKVIFSPGSYVPVMALTREGKEKVAPNKLDDRGRVLEATYCSDFDAKAFAAAAARSGRDEDIHGAFLVGSECAYPQFTQGTMELTTAMTDLGRQGIQTIETAGGMVADKVGSIGTFLLEGANTAIDTGATLVPYAYSYSVLGTAFVVDGLIVSDIYLKKKYLNHLINIDNMVGTQYLVMLENVDEMKELLRDRIREDITAQFSSNFVKLVLDVLETKLKKRQGKTEEQGAPLLTAIQAEKYEHVDEGRLLAEYIDLEKLLEVAEFLEKNAGERNLKDKEGKLIVNNKGQPIKEKVYKTTNLTNDQVFAIFDDWIVKCFDKVKENMNIILTGKDEDREFYARLTAIYDEKKIIKNSKYLAKRQEVIEYLTNTTNALREYSGAKKNSLISHEMTLEESLKNFKKQLFYEDLAGIQSTFLDNYRNNRKESFINQIGEVASAAADRTMAATATTTYVVGNALGRALKVSTTAAIDSFITTLDKIKGAASGVAGAVSGAATITGKGVLVGFRYKQALHAAEAAKSAARWGAFASALSQIAAGAVTGGAKGGKEGAIAGAGIALTSALPQAIGTFSQAEIDAQKKKLDEQIKAIDDLVNIFSGDIVGLPANSKDRTQLERQRAEVIKQRSIYEETLNAVKQVETGLATIESKKKEKEAEISRTEQEKKDAEIRTQLVNILQKAGLEEKNLRSAVETHFKEIKDKKYGVNYVRSTYTAQNIERNEQRIKDIFEIIKAHQDPKEKIKKTHQQMLELAETEAKTKRTLEYFRTKYEPYEARKKPEASSTASRQAAPPGKASAPGNAAPSGNAAAAAFKAKLNTIYNDVKEMPEAQNSIRNFIKSYTSQPGPAQTYLQAAETDVKQLQRKRAAAKLAAATKGKTGEDAAPGANLEGGARRRRVTRRANRRVNRKGRKTRKH